MLGTGRMGAAMSRRLVDAGHRVRVWNRTSARAEALRAEVGGAGLDVADTPTACVDGADVVLSMLADGTATTAVLLDPPLEVLAADTVVCDLGTSGVEAAHELARAYAASDRRFVDSRSPAALPPWLPDSCW